MTQRYTFSKAERLCSKNQIDLLFSQGKSIRQYPFTLLYCQNPELPTSWPQVLISVSKKKFKRANKRNRVKRLIREIYRLNKHQFFNGSEQLLLGILYQSNELNDFDFLQKKLILGLQRFKEESGKALSENSPEIPV
jgi:ribonuclease P protein component